MKAAAYLSDFIQEHRLPESYLETARQWYDPLADSIQQQAQNQTKPFFTALNGCQGSGKSTLAAYLAIRLKRLYNLNTAIISLDDFYLSQCARSNLAKSTHPLLKTRGVPGTHDTKLLRTTLDQLAANIHPVTLPTFNKAEDNPNPSDQWPKATTPVDVVILEGWCMGAEPESEAELSSNCNELESSEDPKLAWRTYANNQLRTHYLPIFRLFNFWIMLTPPSLSSTLAWRQEQEHKLLEHNQKHGLPVSNIMSDAKIERFIQHYQRITVNCQRTLPPKVHFLYELDDNRHPQQLTHPIPTPYKALDTTPT